MNSIILVPVVKNGISYLVLFSLIFISEGGLMREIINIFFNIFKRSYDIIIFGRYWYINQKTLLTWNRSIL